MKKLLLLLLIVPMISFGQYGQQPIQVELSGQRPTYVIPESHVFEIFRASDLTVFKLNKITGDVTGYYLSGGGKGTYKIYDSPKQVGE